MNITVDERARATQAGRTDRILYTTKPLNPRTVARARWIGRFSATILLGIGLYFAATGSPIGDLVAIYAFTTGAWCWRHQRSMKPAR